MTPPDKKPMKCILVTLPADLVDQLDSFSSFYCKSRLAFIRDFINEGIKNLAVSYAGKEKELQEMNRIFTEMEQKRIKFEAQKKAARTGRWEDSY